MSLTGELIRKARTGQNLSQVEVAHSMGFTNAFLNRIEAGICDLPAKHVDKIAKVLSLHKEEVMKVLKKDLASRLEKRAR